MHPILCRALVIFAWTFGQQTCIAFSPQTDIEFQAAVFACTKTSAYGDCSADPEGPMEMWDVSRVTTMRRIFFKNEFFNANISQWNVVGVTDMSEMFKDALSFNADISQWDVARVTDLSGIFDGAESFNADISKWDVARVTKLDYTFFHASSFDADISKWNVSSVVGLVATFYGVKSFNPDISQWDVSRVIHMQYLFKDAEAFNADISKWNVASVQNMEGIFYGAKSFNADLSKWDVSRVANMALMFSGAESFNGDISEWSVRRVANMWKMFQRAISFRGDLSRWKVGRVRNMRDMFNGATLFNSDISKWVVERVRDMKAMFKDATSFNADISPWNVVVVSSMDSMFQGATSFDHKLCGASWLSSRASKKLMFENSPGSISETVCTFTTTLAQDRGKSVIKWFSGTSEHAGQDCDKVCETFGGVCESSAEWPDTQELMEKISQEYNLQCDTFCERTDIGQAPIIVNGGAIRDLQCDGDPGVETGQRCVYGKPRMRPDLPPRCSRRLATRIRICPCNLASGNTTSTTNQYYYRYYYKYYYTYLTDFASMTTNPFTVNAPAIFSPLTRSELVNAVVACIEVSEKGGCSRSVYGHISEWDVSRITDMTDVFRGEQHFNADISKWDMSRVTTMKKMFYGATFFEADISNWDVSHVTDMQSMFSITRSFNVDISKWDVSRVVTMRRMFAYARSFNADISQWDVSNVINMKKMFHGAASFNVTISSWDLGLVTDISGMFYEAAQFNVSISKWNVAQVRSMSFMFYGAQFFNADISDWDVGNVMKMWSTFNSAKKFNGDLSKWNVSSVMSMGSMFNRAVTFNADISKWDVSRVTNMISMFLGAHAFNADISKWDVAKVLTMRSMFEGAFSFNSDITNWNVERVSDMGMMFKDATSFNHVLCRAAWFSAANKYQMFENSLGSFSPIVCTTTTIPTSSTSTGTSTTTTSTSTTRTTTTTITTSSASANIANTTDVVAPPPILCQCGKHRVSDKYSCCFPGGSWFKICGELGNETAEHTWYEGIVACQGYDGVVPLVTPNTGTTSIGPTTVSLTEPSQTSTATLITAGPPATTSPKAPDTAVGACPRCGTFLGGDQSGKMSCCAPGGSWYENCGGSGDPNFDHTWFEGSAACRSMRPMRPPPKIDPPVITTIAQRNTEVDTASSIEKECPKCGIFRNSGKKSCCAPGGTWYKKCGIDLATSPHTWNEGVRLCNQGVGSGPTISTTPPTTTPITNPILSPTETEIMAVPTSQALLATGTTTVASRITAASTSTKTVVVSTATCPKCATFNKSGKISCCAPSGAWHKKCGFTGDEKFEHTWSEGIAACEGVDDSNSNRCPRCTLIEDTGKLSCCATGAAWFEKCGNENDPNFSHTWADGIMACRKPTTIAPPNTNTFRTIRTSKCPECGVFKKNGKYSCCAAGGSWFGNCGLGFDYTWNEGTEACAESEQSRLQSTISPSNHQRAFSEDSSVSSAYRLNSRTYNGMIVWISFLVQSLIMRRM